MHATVILHTNLKIKLRVKTNLLVQIVTKIVIKLETVRVKNV